MANRKMGTKPSAKKKLSSAQESKDEKRFQRTIENAPVGYYRVGTDGLWQYVNRQWESMHGYSAQEIIGKSFEITQPEEAMEQARENVRRVLSGETITGEFPRRRKDGTIEYHSFNIQPVYEHGEIVAIEGFLSDITELKHALDILAEEEEKYQKCFSMVSDAIIIFDAETRRILYVNPGASNLYGYTQEEFLKLKHTDITAEPEASEVSIRETLAGNRIRVGLRLHRKRDGSEFPVEISASSFVWRGRNVLCGFVRDITHRVEAEEDLKRSESAVREQKQALEDKNIALREIIAQVEVEKRQIREALLADIHETVFPVLERLSTTEENRQYVDMLQRLLREMTASFGGGLRETSVPLSPREKEICRMIKGGLTSKEISALLRISSQTVHKHRHNIRKKLGIARGTSLASHLAPV